MPGSQAASPGTTEISALDAHLGFWLRILSNRVSDRFRLQLEKQGTTVTEWVALRVLYGETQATPFAMRRIMGMTKGAVSKVMDRLEAKGLARRLPVQGRERAQYLALTVRGRALVPRLAAIADQNDDFFFMHLPRGQREALTRTVQDLVAYHRVTELPLS